MYQRFRSLWISDTHLGGKNLKSKQLQEFLQQTESEYLYLVGDIFDLWKVKNGWHWPEVNDHIVNLIQEKARNGTKVIYLPGNHDEMFRKYSGTSINGIEIQDEAIHHGLDGSSYLVLHGDRFDCVVQKSVWLAGVGSFLYEQLLYVNRIYNTYRALRGKDYFSISAYLKNRCKKAVNYIGSYEKALTAEVEKHNVDGIICGHIHSASLKSMNRFIYGNAGDWVESCTALAENTNGTMGLIEWAAQGFDSTTEHVGEHEKNRYRDGCLAPTN